MRITGVEVTLAMQEEPGDAQDAMVVLGLHPHPEPDKGRAGHDSCAYCGRADPPGGLTYDLGNHPDREVHAPGPHGIPVVTRVPPSAAELHAWHVTPHAGGLHCRDSAGCHAEHDRREPAWLTRQYPMWRQDYARVKTAQIDYAKAARARQYAEDLAARRRFATPEHQWGLTGEAEDRLFEEALAHLREITRPSPEVMAARRSELAEELALASPREPEPVTVQPVVTQQPPHPDRCTHDTLRCPWARQHTLGHMREHLPGVSSAADALGRKAIA